MPHNIRLQPTQRSTRAFTHPIFNQAPIATNRRDEEIFSHLRPLKTIVGRYLYHWPLSQRFLDEMVSVGLTTIVECVDNDSPLQSKRYEPVCRAIEKELNNLQGIVPAPEGTNRLRSRKKQEPIFGFVESSLDTQTTDSDTVYVAVDVLEIVERLRTETRLQQIELTIIASMLESKNWGMDLDTLSQQLGLSKGRIQRYRRNLLARYYKLAGDEHENS